MPVRRIKSYGLRLFSYVVPYVRRFRMPWGLSVHGINMQRLTEGVNHVSLERWVIRRRSSRSLCHSDDREGVRAHRCAIPVNAVASDGVWQVVEDVAGGYAIGTDDFGGKLPGRAV